MQKKLVFLTGTRADYGKIRSLIQACQQHFEVHIFVTGMHMNQKYGETWDEIRKDGFQNQFPFYNHADGDGMDLIVSQTIHGFSHFVRNRRPDMIIVHGDRPETLAGAIVGSFNNILTAHIEGGEISGTLDESIRHSVSKLSHIHFVSNGSARERLLKMGENSGSIFTIGSPGMDLLLGETPSINEAFQHYDIDPVLFQKYALVAFHPVTTEFDQIQHQAKNLVDALLLMRDKYIIIYPNNDHGSDFILQEYKALKNKDRFKLFPSIRHSYYLTLLKHAMYIVGNSSSGIQEAPCYGTPAINIGTRQNGRAQTSHIIHCGYSMAEIEAAMYKAGETRFEVDLQFGAGNSAELFVNTIQRTSTWQISTQKKFC